MGINRKKSLRFFGVLAVAGSVFPNNAFGERKDVNLIAFFDKTRWKENKKEAQARYGDKWKEEYFKNPREVYRANLKDGYKEKLGNTHLYILISSHKQAEKYGEKVVESLEANAQHLQELGVTPHIIVRCDGDRKNGGVTEDIYCYAGELEEKGISFKLHESANVNMQDPTFEGNDPEHAHWELVANEKNLGCSGSRHASTDAIEKEIRELRAQGKRVYIGIFDGDDWVHEDFYPVLVLNALRSRYPVSNYNGRLGAHGLEDTCLRETRILNLNEWGGGWTLYTDMEKDNVEETLSREYAKLHPDAGGQCCTTKIFEAGYFYKKLNSLCENERKYRSDFKRNKINLTTLTCLDGFKNACTCTTPLEGDPKGYPKKGSLFHYTRHQ